MDTILGFIGRTLVVGGGAAVAAYGLFIWLGQKWLEHRFAEQLDRVRHEQAKEVERLRHDVNRLFSRISKIHEREFTALPTAWEKLLVAQGTASHLAIALKEIPDFGRMTGEHLEEFLDATTLPAFRRDEIRKATDKTKAYLEARFWTELTDARQAQADLHNFVGLNWIFMTDELRDAFLRVDKKICEVLIDVEIAHEAPPGSKKLMEDYQALKSLDPVIEDLGRLVQRRLHYEDA
jgi:hypothetical protein